MITTLKKHIEYSNDPTLFMKEKWLTFDAFSTKNYKNVTPFDYQLEFIRNIHNINHNIVVKSRQMHITSMMELYLAWYILFNNKKQVFILSNSLDCAKTILDHIKIILQNYCVSDTFHWEDDFVVNNKAELKLRNGCKIKAIGPHQEASKGHVIDFLYIDEAAFIKNFEMIYAGLGIATSYNPNSKTVIASTPKDNSFFNNMFLNVGDESSFNPIRLHWSIHPVYSKGMTEDKNIDSPFKYTSPWFDELFKRLGYDVGQTEQEFDCVVRYKNDTTKSKTISLRIDGELYKKIQDELKHGESASDYIRKLIEKDLKN